MHLNDFVWHLCNKLIWISVICEQVTKDGLTSEEAARRLEEYGPNKLPEGSRNAFLVYLGYEIETIEECVCL